MKSLKQFFKYRETWLGITTAFVFMLIFFCVWMTAYNGVSDRVNQLKIGITSQDQNMGTTIENNLKKNLPFDVKTYQSVDTAKQEMNRRNLDMVIQIPANFSEQLQTSGRAEIKYFINQANASLAKQIMEGTAQDVTSTINDNIYAYKQKVILSQLSKQLSTAVPSQELAQNISASISHVMQSLTIHSVHSSIIKTNNVNGFPATMVPLLVVLASFVGSMIMSLNLNGAAMKMRQSFNKWSVFLSRQMINVGAAVLLAVISLIFMAIFKIDLHTPLLETWAFQTLVYFSFLSLTQMFVILFGPAGMLFNILSMALQLVTSGVIVPKVMLSDFYQTLGSLLPATYVADGYYTVIFGGVSLPNDTSLLLAVSAITLLIAAVRVLFQRTQLSETSELDELTGQTEQ